VMYVTSYFDDMIFGNCDYVETLHDNGVALL
jgi:hypothetical protein